MVSSRIQGSQFIGDLIMTYGAIASKDVSAYFLISKFKIN